MKNRASWSLYCDSERQTIHNFKLELGTMWEMNRICKSVGVQKATLDGDIGIKNSHSSIKNF